MFTEIDPHETRMKPDPDFDGARDHAFRVAADELRGFAESRAAARGAAVKAVAPR